MNTSVVFNCTSGALPVAKYRFYRITGAGENEVSTSSSASTGVLVVSSIMHPSGSYIVKYKCVPYNMLGDGPDRTLIVDVQGMYNLSSSFSQISIVNFSPPPISAMALLLFFHVTESSQN